MDQFFVTLFCTFGVVWVLLYMFGGIYLVEDVIKIVRWFRGTDQPPSHTPTALPTGVMLVESHEEHLLEENDTIEEDYLDDDELSP